MCRSCGSKRERKVRPVLFKVDCPECGQKAPAYNIYSCWCEWCGALMDLDDGKVIRCHNEAKLGIHPSMALRNKGNENV